MTALLCSVGLSVIAAASASARPLIWPWTAHITASAFEDEYETVDPWALREAKAKLQDDLDLGFLETSSRIRQDRSDVESAKHAATVEQAGCRGVGAHERAYYERFWCTIHLYSWMSRYEASKKITVRPTGIRTFVVKNGFH